MSNHYKNILLLMFFCLLYLNWYFHLIFSINPFFGLKFGAFTENEAGFHNIKLGLKFGEHEES